jgi:hypothetical protein
MRRFSWLLLLGFAGCASSGPAGPTLELPLTYTEDDFEDAGGILPITGLLELKIEPSGQATSSVMRKILTNMDRKGDLTGPQLTDLHALVEAWVKKGSPGPSLGTPAFASLTYGTKRVAWKKETELPPELSELARFLRTLPPTLTVIPRKR